MPAISAVRFGSCGSCLPSGPTERWAGQLERVLALPEDAPLRLTWTVHPAVRWARERPAGELLERHARLLLTTLGVIGPEREQFLSGVAWTDPVVLDAGLFDGGLFQRYLTEALRSGSACAGGLAA